MAISTLYLLPQPMQSIAELIDNTALSVDTARCNAEVPQVIKTSVSIVEFVSTSEELDVLDPTSKLNHVFTTYLIQIRKDDACLLKLITLLDIGIALEKSFSHTAVNILVQIFTLFSASYLTTHFLPIFLANDTRKQHITKHNTLKGKVKPGSRLLILYNLISHKLAIRDNQSTQLILGKFRAFILQAFEINDKLNKAHDWHIKPSNITGPGANSLIDIIGLYNCLTDVGSLHNLSQIEGFLKELQEVEPTYVAITDKISKFDGWTANDAASLNLQISDFDFYGAIILQVKIVLEFALAVQSGDVAKLHISTKIRKPEFQISMFPQAVRKINHLLIIIQNLLKGNTMPNINFVNNIIKTSEMTFTKMKTNAFSYPSLASLKEFKNNREKHLIIPPSIEKKPYPHKMGTPRISKVWRTNTTMQGYIIKRYSDIAESGGGDDSNVREQWKNKRATRETSWFDLRT